MVSPKTVRQETPPCAVLHYWVITAEQLLLTCQWDLENNDAVEIATMENTAVVVGQRKGLPIGGNLPAYVELVALKREYEVSTWLACLPYGLIRCEKPTRACKNHEHRHTEPPPLRTTQGKCMCFVWAR